MSLFAAVIAASLCGAGCSRKGKYEKFLDIPGAAYDVVSKHKSGMIKRVKVKRELRLRGMLIEAPGLLDVHTNARIALAKPAETVTFKEPAPGLSCKGGSLVAFFDSGKLRHCTLASEATIGGKKYAAGSGLSLDESGAVASTYDAKKPPLSFTTK